MPLPLSVSGLYGDLSPAGARFSSDGKVIHQIVSRQTFLKEYLAIFQKPPPPPPSIPDWGLGPAASSWTQIPLPHAQRLSAQPNKPRNHVHRDGLKMATIIGWDLPKNIGINALSQLFVEANGVVDIFHSRIRCLFVADFATRRAADEAFYKLARRKLGRKIKIAFFDNDTYVLNRDTSSLWEIPGRLNDTVCIEGFDSSLHVQEVRTMLAQHFGSDDKGLLMIPTNFEGSSIGKAYIKCENWFYYSEALSLNGSELGGHKLRVTECCGGNKIWVGRITPNGPSIGKKIVFNNDSDEE